MWDSKDFVADLEKIQQGKYNELSTNNKTRPSDLALLYRYNYITLLALFRQNDFINLQKHSNAYLESVENYIKDWNPEYLDTGIASPPFDFCLLVFMTATNGEESHNKLIRLFKFYKRIDNYLSTQNQDRQVLLTDKPNSTEMMTKVGKAREIIQQRINYIAENIASLLNSINKKDILINFLTTFVPPESVSDEQTLSCFGRLALSCGERNLASKYFDLVKNSQIKSLNQGYIFYFDNNFAEAQKCFSGKLESGVDACKRHMGEISNDITEQSPTRKQTPESRSQWPAPPRFTN